MMEGFEDNGVVVIRNLINREQIALCQDEWEEISQAGRKVGWNPVAVDVPDGGYIRQVAENSLLRSRVLEALDTSPTVYNVRLVVKDRHSHGPVFLHQDSCYHIGSLPKLSAFVALSSVIPENGGLKFWLGTHKYGYLGDAGEIDPSWANGKHEVICPVLAPGDVVLMHSSTWHESGPNTCGLDRVLIDIIYQRFDDPARAVPREGVFKSCRVSRMKELQAMVDSLVVVH